ncbi:MAG TPA: aminotransferase class I/II-fold pyridoxal phosphate-dependent enzyme [Streptosporangiaceae bacterium]|nr:aminotransferase class I/II-fold pyridoxal phosphate-dependent enzyme [Streptosporangiaceae bacterium]
MSGDGQAFLGWLAAEAAEREAAGLTRRLRIREAAGDGVLDMAGNDYLGLSGDPRLVEAAAAAAREWGAGAGASRLVTGTTRLHAALEEEAAAFCGQRAGLVFSSGYLANLGVVAALAGRGDLVVSDAHVHASLVDACRLSRARVAVVPHADVGAVAAALAGRSEARAVVLTESIFSVLGDPAPLPELADACAAHGAVLVVDEAHALGVAGPAGRGLVHAAGIAGRPDVVVTATLSKALGGQGGLVLGDPALREHLVNRARAFVYDTGLAPPAAGAARAALRVLAAEPDRVAAVRAAAARLAAAVGRPAPAGAVLAVAMPGPEQALRAAERCAERGVRVGCFRPPSVPDRISRLRVTARATLTDVQVGHAASVLGEVAAVYDEAMP